VQESGFARRTGKASGAFPPSMAKTSPPRLLCMATLPAEPRRSTSLRPQKPAESRDCAFSRSRCPPPFPMRTCRVVLSLPVTLVVALIPEDPSPIQRTNAVVFPPGGSDPQRGEFPMAVPVGFPARSASPYAGSFFFLAPPCFSGGNTPSTTICDRRCEACRLSSFGNPLFSRADCVKSILRFQECDPDRGVPPPCRLTLRTFSSLLHH